MHRMKCQVLVLKGSGELAHPLRRSVQKMHRRTEHFDTLDPRARDVREHRWRERLLEIPVSRKNALHTAPRKELVSSTETAATSIPVGLGPGFGFASDANYGRFCYPW